MSGTTGYQAGIESNVIEMSYAQEAQWGVLPAVPFQAIRMMSEGFKGEKQRQRPSEINNARQASAAVTTRESASGSINFALSAGTYDDLLSGLLGGDWSTTLAIAATDIEVDTNSFVSATAHFTNVQVGQWVKVAGFTTTANNGFHRVTAKAGDSKSITVASTLVDEAAGDSVTIAGSMVRNGVVFKSFHFQKKLAADKFLRYPGTSFSTGTLNAQEGNFIQGTFNAIVKQELEATANASTGAILAAPTGKVHDGVSGFQALTLDDVAITTVVDQVNLNLNNEGATANYGLGSAAAQGVIPGTFTGSGSLRTFFRDFDLYQRFKNETGSRLSYRTLDDTGKGYALTLLNATIMNPSIVAGGPNQPVMAEFQLEMNPDPVTGRTFQIDRFLT